MRATECLARGGSVVVAGGVIGDGVVCEGFVSGGGRRRVGRRSSSTRGGERADKCIYFAGRVYSGKSTACCVENTRAIKKREYVSNGMQSASRRGHQHQRPRTGHVSARGRMHDTSPGERIGDVVVRHVQAGGRETLVPITVPLRCPRLSSCGPISSILGPVPLASSIKICTVLAATTRKVRKPCAPPHPPGGHTRRPSRAVGQPGSRAARVPGPVVSGPVAVVASPVASVQAQSVVIDENDDCPWQPVHTGWLHDAPGADSRCTAISTPDSPLSPTLYE